MEAPTSARQTPEEEAGPDTQPDTQEGAERPPKRLGPLGALLLLLAAYAVLFACVIAALAVAFLLGGNIALTTVLVLVAMVPAILLAGKVLDHRRRRLGVDQAVADLDPWARRIGLRRSDDAAVTFDVPAAPFDYAGRHTAVHAWTGQHGGFGVAVVHYLVDTGTSKHPERELHTVVAATGNGDFPLMEAVPQRGAAAIAARVGRDLDVESAEFNEAWRVSAVDESAGHALLTPRVIERMIRAAADPVRTVWSGGVILTVQDGLVLDPEVLTRRVSFVSALAGLVPGFARTDGGASGAPSAAGARAEVTARRSRTRSTTELPLLLLGLAAFWGGGALWANVGPAVGAPIVLLSFVIMFRSTRMAAWIDRRRGRGTANPPR